MTQNLSRSGLFITIEPRGSAWLVTTSDGTAATWTHLDWAALSALDIARHLGAPEPRLGAGVPSDALARGRLLGEALEHRREPAGDFAPR